MLKLEYLGWHLDNCPDFFNNNNYKKINSPLFCLEVKVEFGNTDGIMIFEFLYCNVLGLNKYVLNNFLEGEEFLHLTDIYFVEFYHFETLNLMVSNLANGIIDSSESNLEVIKKLNNIFTYRNEY